jgi:hypothetical protein
MDSNLSKTYWDFQVFVWWGHKLARNDLFLTSLRILTSLSQLGLFVLLFITIS